MIKSKARVREIGRITATGKGNRKIQELYSLTKQSLSFLCAFLLEEKVKLKRYVETSKFSVNGTNFTSRNDNNNLVFVCCSNDRPYIKP